jgi:RNA polymerase sigma-70 factor (ECF subfamily)
MASGGGVDRAPAERRIADDLGRGDLRAAAVAALKLYGEEILLYLRRLTREEEVAQDAFSDFCERLWQNLARFRFESSLRTWAYTLAWSTFHAQLRDPYRRRGRRLQDHELSGIAAEVRQSTAPYLRSEARDRLHEARESLDPEERSLLVLRVEHRLSWREIAAIMSTEGAPATEATLRKRYERIRERLRDLMQVPAG